MISLAEARRAVADPQPRLRGTEESVVHGISRSHPRGWRLVRPIDRAGR
jgi:hypothetical protein